MQIWYMEPYPCGDRRMPHHVFPPKVIGIDTLQSVTGVTYFKVDIDNTVAMKKRLTCIRTERNKVPAEIVVLDSETIPNLNAKLDDLYEPVTLDDEQVVMVTDGAMYYDIEYEDSEWIRILVERGDLIIIPKGVSHRCTTTPKDYAKIQRFSNRDVIQG
uniref:1,2-dihydroxy-3-keto-5-methylthiopentene dioxygenase homolog n=1 Tax=Panagrellus redivivus TaxID=6233 RepID=A0A7E4W7T6_PANRE